MTGILRGMARLVPRGLRNWMRSPRATMAWLWDDLRHRAGSHAMVEIRPGWTLRCHPAAYRMAYRAHLDDAEQVRELDSFIAACRPGMVLFDLGAHFGLFSLAAARYGGPEARAVTVDPSGFACRMTRQESALNGATERITVVEAAVAARSGTSEMVPVGVIAAGYYSAATASHGRAERQVVRAVTVDELAGTYHAWPTHVKVDVEGAEAEVLRGARAALARHPAPVLFLELHNGMLRARGADPAETLDLLDEMGYVIFGLDGRQVNRAAILEPDLVRVVARPAGAAA